MIHKIDQRNLRKGDRVPLDDSISWVLAMIDGVQVVGGSNPLTPTLNVTGNQKVVKQQTCSLAFLKRNLHPNIC